MSCSVLETLPHYAGPNLKKRPWGSPAHTVCAGANDDQIEDTPCTGSLSGKTVKEGK